MKKIFVLSTILLTFLGCKKDPALEGNKPKLTFKSVSTEDVPVDMKMLTFTFQLQDADGDVENIMKVNDIRFGDPEKWEDVYMPLLESHKGTKIDAELTLYSSDMDDQVRMRLRYGTPTTNPDTLQFRVFVLDNAGNSSDTLTLPKVAVHN